MFIVFTLFFVLGFVLFIIGLFNAKASLYWFKGERTKKKSALVYGITVLVSLFGMALSAPSSSDNIPDSPSDDVRKELVQGKECQNEYTDDVDGMDEDGKTEKNRKSRNSKSADKEWTEVFSMKGSGMKGSPCFKVNGEVRIQYAYKAITDLGIGSFCVYFLEEDTDLERDGGFPVLSTMKQEDDGVTYLHKRRGTYYIYVVSDGNWAVQVEEAK